MRFKKSENGVSVQAITGTHVVILGMNMAKSDTKNLLGFAIHRTDPKENEAYWLPGMRTFEASYPHPPEGALASSQEHPIQDFLWSDFTAKPGRIYTYHIVPVTGKPKNLQYGDGVKIEVKTEKETGSKHSIYFNRAVIGSQAYARNFSDAPNKLTGEEKKRAYDWLSRGLVEALHRFLAEAKDASYGIRAAVYEFDYEPVVAAFGAARKACQDVKIVYDARLPKEAKAKASAQKRIAEVEALLKKYGLKSGATPRQEDGDFISHNKFIVLLKDQQPVAVWTGSTNFTESGIFGHANVGHLVRDKKVAAAYLAYWERLKADPTAEALREENDTASPTLTDFPPPPGATSLFSPRRGLKQLNWYALALDSAENLSCFTAAFGVNKVFRAVFRENKDYLRYIFLEKWGTTKTTSEETETDLSGDPDIQVTIGAFLNDQVLYHWLREFHNTLSRNIKFVHTKFMLIDPLSEDPVVISGSANFSDASTSQNDENMLVIRGDQRVADIYLGEFMRLWRHHRARFIVNKINEQSGKKLGPNYLDPTPKWAEKFYKEGQVKFKRRITFAGTD